MKLASGILIVFFFALAAHAENWTIEKLVGVAPEYDGASCYTAALLAKGYVDTVSFVGVEEVRFFLDNFCEEKTGPLESNDLITLTPREFFGKRPHIYHIATYLGDGKVFEKQGGLGKFEPYVVEDPRFLIQSMKDSPWFKNYQDKDLILKSYRCENAETVRSKIATCEARVNAFGLADLRQDFERVLLTTPASFNPSSSNIPIIKKLAQELDNLTESDPCYDYILAMGEMVGSSFKSVRIKHMEALSDEWKEARFEIEKVLRSKFNIF